MFCIFLAFYIIFLFIKHCLVKKENRSHQNDGQQDTATRNERSREIELSRREILEANTPSFNGANCLCLENNETRSFVVNEILDNLHQNIAPPSSSSNNIRMENPSGQPSPSAASLVHQPSLNLPSTSRGSEGNISRIGTNLDEDLPPRYEECIKKWQI